MARTHRVVPGVSWGTLSYAAQQKWHELKCDEIVTPEILLDRRAAREAGGADFTDPMAKDAAVAAQHATAKAAPFSLAPLSSCPFASAMAIGADPPSLSTLGGPPAAPGSAQPPSTLHAALAGLATDSLRTLEPRMQSSPSGGDSSAANIKGAQLVF